MKTIEKYGRQAWVIGSPISHTLSPPIHNAAFEAAGLRHRYFAMEVEPEDLGTFLTTFKQVNGLGANLTLPLKETVRDFVERETEAVERTGAANTLYWADNDELALDNTDVYGFCKLVEDHEDRIRDRPVLLLGAGGAARACLLGLEHLGVGEVRLWNRTTEKAERLADRFSAVSIDVLSEEQLESDEEATLVVNATSLGLEAGDPSPFPADVIEEGMVGVDLIYGRETQFQQDFERHGAGAVDGLTMLVRQAARAWERWVGESPDVAAMESAVREADSDQ